MDCCSTRARARAAMVSSGVMSAAAGNPSNRGCRTFRPGAASASARRSCASASAAAAWLSTSRLRAMMPSACSCLRRAQRACARCRARARALISSRCSRRRSRRCGCGPAACPARTFWPGSTSSDSTRPATGASTSFQRGIRHHGPAGQPQRSTAVARLRCASASTARVPGECNARGCSELLGRRFSGHSRRAAIAGAGQDEQQERQRSGAVAAGCGACIGTLAELVWRYTRQQVLKVCLSRCRLLSTGRPGDPRLEERHPMRSAAGGRR